MTQGPVVEITGLTKRYRRTVVFEDVSLRAGPGEILGIIGPNGAGKTTLLRILVGLVRPTRGQVSLGGLGPGLCNGSGRLSYFAGESTLPANVQVCTWFRLMAGRSDGTRDSRRVGYLSRGSRQAVGLRAALELQRPSIIVLDEPWEGLDPATSRWLAAALRGHRASGATVLVSSHRLHDLAGVCDLYAFLARGRLRWCRAEDLQAGGAVMAEDLARALEEHARECV